MDKINDRLLSWASILEDNTREQAVVSSTMRVIWPHLALMPDAHLGKGATVGSVIPTRNAVMPAAVGVDIGCGMMAVRTQFSANDVRDAGPLSDLREAIEAAIPMSAGNYRTPQDQAKFGYQAELSEMARTGDVPVDEIAPNWRLQLGTLGAGNHFVEITADEEDRVWTFLHSGSRGVGNKIAQRGIKAAQELMKRYGIALPNPDLAFLPQGDPEFSKYIRAMMWAQRFAELNREEMTDRTMAALAEHMGVATVYRAETIACHHNYTTKERHFGEDLWVTRKGAIDAHEGVLGLIPGSMGAKSHVVVGKGNRAAMCSAPHGAGRVYGRNVARKTFTHDDLRKQMAEAGVEWRDDPTYIDEIPSAYKDLDVVMEDAADLVEIRHTLRQLLVCKGA